MKIYKGAKHSVLVLACIIGAEPLSANNAAGENLAVSGPPQVVYSWSRDRCREWMFPDAPARAFVDETSNVALIAADDTNWFMRGTSLNKVTVSCTSAFSANSRPESQAFDSMGWIEATFTSDGKDVLALISNDWAANVARSSKSGGNACPRSKANACHYLSINVAQSTNGGYSFLYLGQQHVVAAKPIADLSDNHQNIGFATASNLFEKGGYIYTFLGARTQEPGSSGSCLFRLRSTNTTKWEYWDGQAFIGVAGTNSAREEQQDSPTHCSPVHVTFPSAVELRSVSYFRPCQCYIGVFEGAMNILGSVVSGFFATTSMNLRSWSTPQLLMRRPLVTACKEMLVYPSILDPAASTRNFSDITAHPYLYYTRINRTSCKGTLDRDLVRVPIVVGDP